MKIYAKMKISNGGPLLYYEVSSVAIDSDSQLATDDYWGYLIQHAVGTLSHSDTPSSVQSSLAASVRSAWGAPLLTPVIWTVEYVFY